MMYSSVGLSCSTPLAGFPETFQLSTFPSLFHSLLNASTNAPTSPQVLERLGSLESSSVRNSSGYLSTTTTNIVDKKARFNNEAMASIIMSPGWDFDEEMLISDCCCRASLRKNTKKVRLFTHTLVRLFSLVLFEHGPMTCDLSGRKRKGLRTEKRFNMQQMNSPITPFCVLLSPLFAPQPQHDSNSWWKTFHALSTSYSRSGGVKK